MNDNEITAGVDGLCFDSFEAPSPAVMDFADIVGDMMKGRFASDNPNGLDSGGGFGQRDLWVKHGGKEFLVTIRESNCDA